MQRVKTKYERTYFQIRATEDARFEPWTATLFPRILTRDLNGDAAEVHQHRLEISVPIPSLMYSSRFNARRMLEIPGRRVDSTLQFPTFDLERLGQENIEYQVRSVLIDLTEEIKDYIRNHMEDPMTASRGNIPPLVPIPDPNRTYATEVFNDTARVPNPPPLVPIVSVTLVTPMEPAGVDPILPSAPPEPSEPPSLDGVSLF